MSRPLLSKLRDHGVFWVCPRTRYTSGEAHWYNQFREGLQDNIGLVLAKTVLGLDAVLCGARYIAAYSPTERTQLQTAMVARRLSRGHALYEEREDATSP